jgi:hypothetical protein
VTVLKLFLVCLFPAYCAFCFDVLSDALIVSFEICVKKSATRHWEKESYIISRHQLLVYNDIKFVRVEKLSIQFIQRLSELADSHGLLLMNINLTIHYSFDFDENQPSLFFTDEIFATSVENTHSSLSVLICKLQHETKLFQA